MILLILCKKVNVVVVPAIADIAYIRRYSSDIIYFRVFAPPNRVSRKIKSVICLSAHLSCFFRQDPREIQFSTAIKSAPR
jgi:hypothetical protein